MRWCAAYEQRLSEVRLWIWSCFKVSTFNEKNSFYQWILKCKSLFLNNKRIKICTLYEKKDEFLFRSQVGIRLMSCFMRSLFMANDNFLQDLLIRQIVAPVTDRFRLKALSSISFVHFIIRTMEMFLYIRWK